MEDRTITLMNDNGEEIICDILFTYHSDEYEKNYVVFQPRGGEEVSAACYVEAGDGNGSLEKIETEEEWNLLEELLEDYANQLEEAECHGECGGCSGCGSDDCDCEEGNCDCGGKN